MKHPIALLLAIILVIAASNSIYSTSELQAPHDKTEKSPETLLHGSSREADNDSALSCCHLGSMTDGWEFGICSYVSWYDCEECMDSDPDDGDVALCIWNVSSCNICDRWRFSFRFEAGTHCRVQIYPSFNGVLTDQPNVDQWLNPGDTTGTTLSPVWNGYKLTIDFDHKQGRYSHTYAGVPYYNGTRWELQSLALWSNDNIVGQQSMPVIGDSTGSTSHVYAFVDLSEYLSSSRDRRQSYAIVNGECGELPGFFFGTTPVEFDSLAGPDELPFDTSPFTGTLHLVGSTDIIDNSLQCGDADASGAIDIDDVVYLINFIFAGGPAPNPYESGDANCSGGVDIDDVVYLIAYIFSGGSAPCDSDGDDVPDC